MAKKIVLKCVKVEETEQEFSYKANIMMALRSPKDPRGMDFEEMDQAIPIIRKFKEAEDGDEVILEDAEFRFLRDRVEALRWNRATEAARDFVVNIKNSETVKITATTTEEK